MAKRPMTEKRHQKVRAAFDTWKAKKDKRGNQIYSNDYILDQIAAAFDYSPKTVEKILFGKKAETTPEEIKTNL